MKKLRQIIIALTALAFLSACVSEKTHSFREIATNPYDLEGKRAQLQLTNGKTMEMDVESIQGNHLYGEGKYVPISVIKSATTAERGLPGAGAGGIATPVKMEEMPTFLGAFVVLTFPLLIILGVTAM